MTHRNDYAETEDEDASRGKYLTFVIAEECYGIDIRSVQEILGFQPITEIPEMPDFLDGIMDLRGTIIPVMNIRKRFKKPFREYTDRTCIIIVKLEATFLGLIVDTVSDVIQLEDSSIVPIGATLMGFNSRYLKGIGNADGEIRLILAVEKLLEPDEIADMIRRTTKK